eukprot:361181-Chlamydomonas_euryale.AAC.2
MLSYSRRLAGSDSVVNASWICAQVRIEVWHGMCGAWWGWGRGRWRAGNGVRGIHQILCIKALTLRGLRMCGAEGGGVW